MFEETLSNCVIYHSEHCCMIDTDVITHIKQYYNKVNCVVVNTPDNFFIDYDVFFKQLGKDILDRYKQKIKI